jgi:hypothetical protein
MNKGETIMKEFIALVIMGAVLILTGCTATNTLAKGVSEKSVSASGTFIYSRTGLDKETQTPEMSNLFIWGDYTSVVPGDEIFRFEESEDASIFNSAAKTKKKKVFFATGDKARMDAVINALTGNNK